jgi:signal transduction histidine kinase
MLVTLALAVLVIGAVFAFAMLWRQRDASDDRANAIALEAAKQAERAAAVEAFASVAHDLDNIFGELIGSASTAYDMTPEELSEVFATVEAASRNGRRMVRALRGSTGAPSEQSVEQTLRVIANMHRRCGTNVELKIESDLKYLGQPDHAFRIVYNLLANAAREIESIDGATIRATLTSSELRVTNPLRPGAAVSDRIFERGYSARGSSGLGLAIVREIAHELNMHVSHEVEGGEITFVVSARTSGELGRQRVA